MDNREQTMAYAKLTRDVGMFQFGCIILGFAHLDKTLHSHRRRLVSTPRVCVSTVSHYPLPASRDLALSYTHVVFLHVSQMQV
jgi:hypothetical protein